jgi:hypothetical protein
MIKLKNILNERGDGSAKGFPWQYHKESKFGTDDSDFEYTFNADKSTGIVTIMNSGTNEWDVAFGSVSSTDTGDYTKLTDEGPLKVMATVTEIIKDFLDTTFEKHIEDKNMFIDTDKLIPRKLSFNAQKEKEVGKKGHGQRAKLYQAFLHKQLPGATISKEISGKYADAYIITL